MIEQITPPSNAVRFSSAMNHFADGLQELSEIRVNQLSSALSLGFLTYHLAAYFYRLDLIPAAHVASTFTQIAPLFPIGARIVGQDSIPLSSHVLPGAARVVRSLPRIGELF